MAFVLKSQNVYFSVTGKALDKSNKPVEAGNVIALSAKDSSIIKGDFFTEGNFHLEHLPDSVYILKVTALGYDAAMKPVRHHLPDTVADAGIFILQPGKDLDEIEVVARVPLFENDGEKVKVNVEGTNLGTGGNAIDVLRRSPGIIVMGGERVTVFGKGEPLIYVDGQLLSSPDVLKSLPAADIKSIEILRNPSARYDASGQAVINIITKKANLQGYNGSLTENASYGKFFNNYTGLRFNARKGKWSAALSYGSNQGEGWNSDLYDRHFKLNDSVKMDMHNYIFEREQFHSGHYYRAAMDYSLDSLTTLSAAYNGFYKEIRGFTDNKNTVFQNGAEISTLQTSTKTLPLSVNHNANLNYIRRLDTLGSELFGALQFGNFSSASTAFIFQEVSAANARLMQQKRNRNSSDIRILTGQADIGKHFGKKWKLDAGVKESYVLKSGELNFDNYSNSEWVNDRSYYSGFDFSENILAAYSELRYKNKKFSARAGLRGELTDTYGYSRTLDSQVVKRHYPNLFPSGFVGYDFTDEIRLGLSYSSRIQRPTYQDMDPFINYIDSLSYIRGNPYLLPEYTSALELNLVYDQEITLLTLGYNRVHGALNLVIDRESAGSNLFSATTKNLNYSESYSIGTTIPYENKWWTTATYLGYFWNTFNYTLDGKVVSNFRPMFYMYVYHEFRLKKLFSLEIEGEYTGSGVDGTFTFNPFYYLNLGIKRKFLKDKLTVRLLANDCLSSYKEWGGSNIPGFEVQYYSLENTHQFILSLNYNFGKMRSQEQKNKSVNQEEYERIKMK
jgi:hypothetical protein